MSAPKYCPILSLRNLTVERDGEERTLRGGVRCIEQECAWFDYDDMRGEGTCAITHLGMLTLGMNAE